MPKLSPPDAVGFRISATTITTTARSTTMAKPALDPRDAHTYRVTLIHPHTGVSGTAHSTIKEVVALYHQHENGFIVFKDNAHAAVLAVAASSVIEIERLRTHSILAVADDELDMVIGALREQADQVNRQANDSDTAAKVKHLTALADGLERLRPVAADRAAKDPSSMPRGTGTVHSSAQLAAVGM